MSKNILRPGLAVLTAVCMLSLAACAKPAEGATLQKNENPNETTVFGKVTAIDGSKITLALATMGTGRGDADGRQGGSDGVRNGGQRGQRPDGNTSGGTGNRENASGAGESGERPQTPPSGNGQKPQQGSAPDAQQGGRNGGFGSLALSGETVTLTISDDSKISKQDTRPFESGGNNAPAGGEKSGSSSGTGTPSNPASATGGSNGGNTAASLSDITVGTVVRVAYQNSDQKVLSVTILPNMEVNSASSDSASSQTAASAS